MWVLKDKCGFQKANVDFKRQMWISKGKCAFPKEISVLQMWISKGKYVFPKKQMYVLKDRCGFWNTNVCLKKQMWVFTNANVCFKRHMCVLKRHIIRFCVFGRPAKSAEYVDEAVYLFPQINVLYFCAWFRIPSHRSANNLWKHCHTICLPVSASQWFV